MPGKTLTIRMIGDPVLEQVAKPVEKIDDRLCELADKMVEAMYKANGIGLAAPQVGVGLRMFVLHVDPQEDEDGNPLPFTSPGEAMLLPKMPQAFVNPEILPVPSAAVPFEEGCLSLPKLYASVVRPESIRLKAQLLDGTHIDVECSGLLARAIQHEYDHLDGIVFAKRLDDANLAKIEKGIAKLLKKGGHGNYKLNRIS